MAIFLFVIGPEQVETFGESLTYFTLVQNYRTGSMLVGLGVASTLVIEVSFYVVLPGLAWMFRRTAGGTPAAVLRRQLVGLARSTRSGS